MKNVSENKKYLAILESARELFWKYGFKRVSIEEICTKANASKMTFYKYFPNKIELAKAIFNNVVENGEKKFRGIIESNDTAAGKTQKILLLKLESTNDISPEFLQDFYTGTVPELKEYVAQRTFEAWQILKTDYKKAQEKGVIRKDLNIELLLKVQNKLVELLDDESLVGLFPSRQDLIMEFANLMVYGMMPH
ncbi:MAG: TetR/AcrR family transcriptional regulator [Bacteroidales bacterium]|nr:TetR/AcrR family transcriptional regulator [Bacteroidales bacterium]